MLFGKGRPRVQAWKDAPRAVQDELGRLQARIHADANDLAAWKETADLCATNNLIGPAIEAYASLASAYAESGLLFRAIAVCKRILELDATHAVTQDVLAKLYAARPRVVVGLSRQAIPELPRDARNTQARMERIPLPMSDAAPIPKRAPTATMTVDASDVIIEPEGGDEDARGLARSSLDEAAVDLDTEGAPTVSNDELEAVVDGGLQRLPKVPLFSSLPSESFVELVHGLRAFEAPPEQLILRQGEQSDSLFVIVRGEVRVERQLAGEAAPLELGRLKSEAFFGEMALLSRAPRSASIITCAETELIEIPRAALLALVARDPTIAEILQRFCRARLLRTVTLTSALFRGLPEDVQLDAIRSFQTRTALPGQRLVDQGWPGRGLFVVLQGEVDVTATPGGGAPMLLKRLVEGDLFGEMTLIGSGYATATCTAVRETTLLHLTRRSFALFCDRHPMMRERLVQVHEQRARMNAALLADTQPVSRHM